MMVLIQNMTPLFCHQERNRELPVFLHKTEELGRTTAKRQCSHFLHLRLPHRLDGMAAEWVYCLTALLRTHIFSVKWATKEGGSQNQKGHTLFSLMKSSLLGASSFQPYMQGGGDFTMWKEPFGIMLRPLKTFSCILIVGWAMVTVSSHKDVPIPSLKQNVESSHLPREQLVSVVKNLPSLRQKRDTAECPPDQTITEEMLRDKLMPIYYTPEDLQLCLKGQKLVESLPIISSYAFTYDQLKALKDNLDKEFPNGYPSWLLPDIGVFLAVTNEADIKKWKYTSPDTLAALLGMSPEDDMAKLLIKQYLDSGGQLNSTALDAIGPKYICLLDKDQFSMIDEEAIKTASNFDPSKCSQATLDNLYPKAKRAFSDRHNEFPAYYNLIKPYLGGAPGEDLRALSKNGVNMDIETFMSLRKDSVMALTVDEVKGLLGRNLRELKDHQEQPVISSWIHRQKQSDLDSLDLGLKGGLPDGYIVLPLPSYRKKREAFAFGRI